MRVRITQNFDNDGNLFGLIRKRNAVESGIYLLLVFVIGKILYSLIPSLIVIAVMIMIGVLGGALLIVGIDDQSIGTVLINSINYKKEKKQVSLMPPSDVRHN